MISRFPNVEATLIEERERVFNVYLQKTAALDQAMAEASSAAEDYNQLDEMISILTKSPKEDRISTLPSAGKQENVRSQTTKNATKDHVLPALKTVVEDNPGIDQKEAEDFVKDKLRTQGLGIRGVGSQVQRYLRAEAFRVDDAGRVFLASK